ncbi:MAG: universal stress protein UspA [Legionellales bacterium]|nr:universal stress protein UspA [Legionellales bacterium]|tara:strand:- start:526 stop:966 length:441 start_codon:yes stop_codon:yes gene_type:complete
MASYKHILITSDLSDSSIILCQKASALAGLLNAKLSIIHIVEHLPLMYAGGEFALPLDPKLEEELADEALINLHKQVTYHHIDKKDQYVIVGDKKEEIKAFVIEHHVDLTVVGAHDRHGLDYILGTTADNMLHALPCDMLAIKVDE